MSNNKMLCIHNQSIEPYYNMAVEEYFFRNFKENIFMLWRNNNAIIVGKHQNTLSEINVDYVKEKEIKVVRRMSGGGAVFHDLGNLNFTFIMNAEDKNLVDFKKYTLPIIEVLQKLGVEAKFEGRNDITIDGKKFSGNAVHVFKNRVLQHGTLLFASQMADISEALKVNPLKFKDKAVKSVRSRVTNISDHLKEPLDQDTFTRMIMDHIREKYPEAVEYEITDEDRKNIQDLADIKYSTWDWNFGYQAKYGFEKLIRTGGGNVEFHLEVKDGIIEKCKIFGDYFNTRETSEIEVALVGVKHEENAIREKLSQFEIDDYFRGVSVDELISCMF
jgi:lipoate-protein ligase A